MLYKIISSIYLSLHRFRLRQKYPKFDSIPRYTFGKYGSYVCLAEADTYFSIPPRCH